MTNKGSVDPGISHDQENKRWCLQNAEQFERYVLVRCWLDFTFFRQICKGLCRDTRGTFVGDFENPLHNGYFYVLSHYNHFFMVDGADRGAYTPMPYPYLESMGTNLAMKGDELSPYDVPQLAELYNILHATAGNPMAPSVMDGLFSFYFARRKAQRLAVNFQNNDPYAIIGSAVDFKDTLDSEVSSIQLDNGDSHIHRSLPGEVWMDEEFTERCPTHHAMLNKCLGGGWGKGEGALILSPSGGGKSIGACQWSGEMIAAGWKGAVFVTESTTKRFKRRYYSNFGDIPYNLIKDGMKMDKLDDKQIARVNDIDKVMDERIRLLEWDGMNFMIDTHIERDLEKVGEQLGGLDFVVFDWLSPSVLRYVEGSSETSAMMERSAMYFAKVIERMNIAGLLMGQASPSQSENKKVITPEMGHKCKSLHLNMLVAMGISALKAKTADKDGPQSEFETVYDTRQYYGICKTRVGVPGVVPFNRAYEKQKMIPASNH